LQLKNLGASLVNMQELSMLSALQSETLRLF